MNKIILDKGVKEIVIVEDSICNISKDLYINDLSIEIKDNVKFIINHYSELNNKLNIKILQNNNSEFIYNHSFINRDVYDLKINIDMIGNNSKNIINIHGISDSGVTNIVVDGTVKRDASDNLLD